jgi:SpoVK/Ycf46/Vps4 family AAA+-type ATPase
MQEAGGLSSAAIDWMEDLGDNGLAATTEHFSGAELAGLVRSAASFALARTVEDATNGDEAGVVDKADLKQALKEVRPALGKQDEVLRMRFPLGISRYNSSIQRIMRDLERFTAPLHSDTPRLQSLLLVGGGGNGGAGATALAAWAAAEASSCGYSDYVRFVTSLDVLSSESGGGDEARAAALVDRFTEAKEMSRSLLVLDDVDQLCAGTGPGGYSSIMIATLRALLRSPPASTSTAKAGGQSISKRGGGRTFHILAATSRSDAACTILHELFDETIGKKMMSVVLQSFGYFISKVYHFFSFDSHTTFDRCCISATTTCGRIVRSHRGQCSHHG